MYEVRLQNPNLVARANFWVTPWFTPPRALHCSVHLHAVYQGNPGTIPAGDFVVYLLKQTPTTISLPFPFSGTTGALGTPAVRTTIPERSDALVDRMFRVSAADGQVRFGCELGPANNLSNVSCLVTYSCN